jgi:hypothetical protein
MPQDLGEKYFAWLYAQVCPVQDKDSPRSYTFLCDRMHQIIFDDRVANDDNRSAEGRGLRVEFLDTRQGRRYVRRCAEFLERDASLFEVLVALCRRANFIADSVSMYTWFGIMLENLDVSRYSDPHCTPADGVHIAKILRKMNDRRYGPTGRGGLFPLNHPPEDQRDTELWYQMSYFMNEKHMY